MTLADSVSELPKPLQDLYSDPRFGLVSVRPDTDGVLPYTSVGRLPTSTPALEIPHEDPHLVDESDLPGGRPPPCTFEELIADHGCLATTVDGYTYVYPVQTASDDSDLESKLYDDIDDIAALAATGLDATATGRIDDAEQAFREIEAIAEAWDDPDA